MPRPKKLDLKDVKKLNWDSMGDFLSKEKIDIINHPAANKVICGGKDSGKTRLVLVSDSITFEVDKNANLIKFKKYIKGGITRLHNAFNNVVLEAKMKGYNVQKYVANQSFTYVENADKSKSNTIEYFSLEDSNSIAGIEGKGLGYFAGGHFEEPVMFGEFGKVPNKKEWNDLVNMIKDSTSRANRAYAINNKLETAPKCTWWYTLNPWDLHPIVEDLEENLPEENFLEFIKKNMLKNHTQQFYNIENDTLYVRMTKFANPIIRAIETLLYQSNIKTHAEWESVPHDALNAFPELLELGINWGIIQSYLKEQKQTILSQANIALELNDTMALARILGLRYQGSSDRAKTYDLSKLIKVDSEEVLKSPKTKVLEMSIGVDIDTRKGRGFVITPSYVITQENGILGNKNIRNILVGKQIYIPSLGDSVQLVEMYLNQIRDRVKELIDKSYIYTKGRKIIKYLWMDENRANYLYQLTKENLDIVLSKARKHGSWDIIGRVDYTQICLDNEFIMFDGNNERLFLEMKTSVQKEDENKRDEKGILEKIDFLNSFEYAIYPYRVLIHTPNLVIGKIGDYK